MAAYHVSTSEISGEIYAGVLKPNGTEWRDKAAVTDAALIAVRDYLVNKMKSEGSEWFGYEWSRKDGKKIVLSVAVK